MTKRISNGVKTYNYKKIRNKIMKIVVKANFSKNNKYKDTFWKFHTVPVVEHSLKLGKKFKADLEVLELAALMHDLASVTNQRYTKQHHLYGASMAKKILRDLGLPKEKIIKIENCILNHRGSIHGERESLEEKILATADAMSHFTELADMMFLTYGVHKFETGPGAIWLKGKLIRSWKKIMPAGRKLIAEDYKIAMKVLNKVISRRDTNK